MVVDYHAFGTRLPTVINPPCPLEEGSFAFSYPLSPARVDGLAYRAGKSDTPLAARRLERFQGPIKRLTRLGALSRVHLGGPILRFSVEALVNYTLAFNVIDARG